MELIRQLPELLLIQVQKLFFPRRQIKLVHDFQPSADSRGICFRLSYTGQETIGPKKRKGGYAKHRGVGRFGSDNGTIHRGQQLLAMLRG